MTKYLLIIILSISILYQNFDGGREDWPLSYFGMYKGRSSSKHLYKIETFLVNKMTGDEKNIYNFFENGFYQFSKINQIVFKKTVAKKTLTLTFDELITENSFSLNKSQMQDLKTLLSQQLIPELKLKNIFHLHSSILIRYSYWKNFTPGNKNRPDIKLPLYELNLENMKAADE